MWPRNLDIILLNICFHHQCKKPRLALPRDGEGVGGVEDGVWTEAPHRDVPHCSVQSADGAVGEGAFLSCM